MVRLSSLFFFLNFLTLSSTCLSNIFAHLSKVRDKESRRVPSIRSCTSSIQCWTVLTECIVGEAAGDILHDVGISSMARTYLMEKTGFLCMASFLSSHPYIEFPLIIYFYSCGSEARRSRTVGLHALLRRLCLCKNWRGGYIQFVGILAVLIRTWLPHYDSAVYVVSQYTSSFRDLVRCFDVVLSS
jgi:hypothetical protein